MRSECAGCGLVFSSVSAFDAHRRAATKEELAADPWMKRRCSDPAQLEGWRQNVRGWWTNSQPREWLR